MADALAIASQLIWHYESCVLKPYDDGTGVATIGWGNTKYENGKAVGFYDPGITQERADMLFAFWLKEFAKSIVIHMPGAKPNQLGACISLAYNIGVNAFVRSTALRRYLIGNNAEAAKAIELWNKAGNHVLKGLQRRRRAERLVFEGASPMAAIEQGLIAFP